MLRGDARFAGRVEKHRSFFNRQNSNRFTVLENTIRPTLSIINELGKNVKGYFQGRNEPRPCKPVKLGKESKAGDRLM